MATLYEFALEALYYTHTDIQAHRGAGRQAGVEPGIEQVFGANKCSMTEQVFGFPESGEPPLPCNIEHTFDSDAPNGEHLFDSGPRGLDCSPPDAPCGPPSPRVGGRWPRASGGRQEGCVAV